MLLLLEFQILKQFESNRQTNVQQMFHYFGNKSF